MSKTVFISACEPSADEHCANLIKTASQRQADIKWVGVGGEKMAAAGCELLEDTVKRAAMIYNAFGQVGFYIKLLNRIGTFLKSNNVDLVVVCDSPAFNFHVAKAAKKAGIKVLWYVAPQLWAWAPWRIKKLRRRCDKLACILPFEENWFKERNMDAEFIGNPLFSDLTIDINESYKQYDGYDPSEAKVAILPGSRKHEIETLWPAMQQIALKLQQRFPNIKFLVSGVDDEKLQILKDNQLAEFKCEYYVCDVAQVARRSDFTIVASGSATLQVAAAGCPMVVMYQSNKIVWHLLGKYLIRTPLLSLVNILAGRELVTEFMPYFNSTEPIFDRCAELLADKEALRKLSTDLVNMVKPPAKLNASERIAAISISMLNSND